MLMASNKELFNNQGIPTRGQYPDDWLCPEKSKGPRHSLEARHIVNLGHPSLGEDFCRRRSMLKYIICRIWRSDDHSEAPYSSRFLGNKGGRQKWSLSPNAKMCWIFYQG